MATLDPQAKRVLDIVTTMPDLSTQTVAQARAAHGAGGKPAGPQMETEDALLNAPHGAIPIRIYRPRTDRPLPCLVWLHGGGWVLGNIDTYDGVCRYLAADSGCAVVSVEYRLAPEHKFPAALDDAVWALRLLSRQGAELGLDPDRLAVGGDSAGGNLATVAAGIVSDEVTLKAQTLVYPVTDLRSFETSSYREFGTGHLLTRTGMMWFRDHYLGDRALVADGRVSPLAGEIGALPPALVVTAECDVLRDEGEAYGRAMQRAGVEVRISRYPGVIHEFFRMYTYIQHGRQAIAEVASMARESLTP